jgi:rubrerythrin
MAYMCIKCGLRWHNRPLSGSCPRGGNHQIKMDDGQPGKHWMCSKCGLRAAGSTHPLAAAGISGAGFRKEIRIQFQKQCAN